MAAALYKRYYEEAKGNKEAYDALVAAGNPQADIRVKGTALLYFQQFDRENRKKQCVCRTGEDLVNFLKHLPLSHMAFTLCSTYSEDVESGYLSVEVDPSAKTIQLVGSADDV